MRTTTATKDEALRAARLQAHLVQAFDGRGLANRLVIHSFLSFVGADWDLHDVLDAIRRADDVRWGHGFAGHDLVVMVDGRTYGFDVQRPNAAVSDEGPPLTIDGVQT